MTVADNHYEYDCEYGVDNEWLSVTIILSAFTSITVLISV